MYSLQVTFQNLTHERRNFFLFFSIDVLDLLQKNDIYSCDIKLIFNQERITAIKQYRWIQISSIVIFKFIPFTVGNQIFILFITIFICFQVEVVTGGEVETTIELKHHIIVHQIIIIFIEYFYWPRDVLIIDTNLFE